MRTATMFDAGRTGHEPVAGSAQQLALPPRSPGRILAARDAEEVRERLVGAIQAMYGTCLLAVALSDGEELVAQPVGPPARFEAAQRLLQDVRCRAALERRSLSAPQLFAGQAAQDERAIMTAPVADGDELVAVVAVAAPPGGRDFHALDLVLLEGLAAQASLAHQRLRTKEPDRLHARLRRDLESALHIQRRLMPTSLPAGLGVEAHTEYLPAYGVGGDFFSVAPTADGRIAAAIGDVSGKGVSAALVMSRVSHDMQRALGSGRSPAAILRSLNAGLYEVGTETFVTAACLLLDAKTRRLVVANAGHLPLLVRRASGEVLTCGGASGTPLGMLPTDYEDEELALEPADIVLLATDGVLEALDRPGGARGLARLVELVRAAPHDAAGVSGRVRAAVDTGHEAAGRDDVTWMLLQLDR